MPDDIPLAVEPGRLTVAPGGGGAWDTGMRRWDLFYGVIFVATFAEVLATAGAGRLIAAAALAAMAPWYVFVGRSQMLANEDGQSRRAVVYLVVLVLLFAVADSMAPNTWYLAIALCPHCYDVATPRRAMAAIIVLSCIGAASVGYWDHGQAGAVVSAVSIAIFAIVFSGIYGGYVSGIITQSKERAELITELEATRARLAEVSRQAGAMSERQRLAGEIHDTLAQGFSSILMLIQAADAQLEGAPDTARSQLELAAHTARENLAEARTLVGGLAPAQLRAGTLEDALRRITHRAGAELGIEARFATEGTGRRLPAATEVVLLRTGQEALANVRKHAAAESVAVRLCYCAGRVGIEVTDDGAGFDPALVSSGYGLAGMRARVDDAGGTVTVRSAPAEGTSVRVEVPA